jgi:MipA family protein
MSARLSFAIACAAFTFCTSKLVAAQDAGGAPPDAPMTKDFEFVLGLAAAYRPAYLGSDKYKTSALPLISARWRNGFFAGVGGVGYRLTISEAFSAGLIVGLSPGRDEGNADALLGMGDIKNRAEYGAFASYRFAPSLSLASSVRYGSGNDRDGLLADVALRAMVPLANRNHRLFAGLTATAPSAGLRDVALNVGYGYSISNNATISLGVTGRALQGDAKDSPLTNKANSASANLMFAYRF